MELSVPVFYVEKERFVPRDFGLAGILLFLGSACVHLLHQRCFSFWVWSNV